MSLIQHIGRFFEWGQSSTPGSVTPLMAANPGDSALVMTDFLIAYIPTKVRLPPGTRLTPDTVLAELGLDSLAMILLSGELERRLAVTIAPELLFETPTLNALAAVLHEARQAKDAESATV